jgi:hypothetical protein
LSPAGTRVTRLAWFVGLWLVSVLALAVVAWAIRWLILV